jgi:hypothetical protein
MQRLPSNSSREPSSQDGISSGRSAAPLDSLTFPAPAKPEIADVLHVTGIDRFAVPDAVRKNWPAVQRISAVVGTERVRPTSGDRTTTPTVTPALASETPVINGAATDPARAIFDSDFIFILFSMPETGSVTPV